MPVAATQSGIIWLNSKQYWVAEGTKIRSRLATDYAEKIVIGSYTESSDPLVSSITWDDFSEGIGLGEFRLSDSRVTPKRCWYSNCNLSHPRSVVLGPLATEIGQTDDTEAEIFTPRYILSTFQGGLYALLTTDDGGGVKHRIYKLDTSPSVDWGAAEHDWVEVLLTRAWKDVVVGYIGGTEYIVFSAETSYAYSTDGSSWTERSTEAEHLAIWDNRLWGADYLGRVWHTSSPGSETYVAQLPIRKGVDLAGVPTTDSYVVGLLTLRWIDNEEHLFATTAEGLYYYDSPNDRWVKAGLEWPISRAFGLSAKTWKGDLYIPKGVGMDRVLIDSSLLAVQAMGPDRDYGLPANRVGGIEHLAPGENALYASLTAGVTDVDLGINDLSTITGSVLAWDNKGWQVVFEAPAAGERIAHIHTSSALNEFRLWIITKSTASGRGMNTFYIPLSPNSLNPDEVDDRNYAAAGIIESPWFNVGDDVTGIALALIVDVKDLDSGNEEVTVKYDTDFSGTYTELAGSSGQYSVLSSDGRHVLALPNSTSPAGVAFQDFRWRLELARGSGDTTKTPHVHSVTLLFLRKLPSRYIHQVQLDISGESPDGRPPREQWTDLRTAIDNSTLVEFTFRDDETAAAATRYWVQVKLPETEEEGGLEYAGKATLILVEPQHNN